MHASAVDSLPATLPSAAAKQPSLALRRFAWLLLAYNVLVILWGAVVRATSSGAGCGAHWPLCNGSVLLSHPAVATMIEFAHRASSGLCVVGVLALVVWTFRASARGAWARVTTAVAVVLTLNEALLGALLVLLRHVAKDQSAARSVYLALHLTNTMLMLAALALSAHFLSNGAASRYQTKLAHLGASLPGLAATLIVCVLGSLAALSDTLFPAQTLSSALLQDFAPHTNWLIRLRILHPLSAMVALLFIAWLAFRATTISQVKPERRLAMSVVLLLGFQIALGLADVTLLAPVWMQVLHLLGADLLWIAMIVLTARLCISPKNELAIA
jgi:cytochrome c oxidase assembly protein subunit 15